MDPDNALYTFTNGKVAGGLISDSSGALYGATPYRGLAYCGVPEARQLEKCGTVFKLTPPDGEGKPWTHTTLYSFTGLKVLPCQSHALDDANASWQGIPIRCAICIIKACPRRQRYRYVHTAQNSRKMSRKPSVSWTATDILRPLSGVQSVSFHKQHAAVMPIKSPRDLIHA